MRRNHNRRHDVVDTVIFVLKLLILPLVGIGIFRVLTQWGDNDNSRVISGNILPTNIPLSNPYGNAQLCGRSNLITVPQRIKECDVIEEQLQTISAYPHISSKSLFCIRVMSAPVTQCFTQAINDGTNALEREDQESFS